MNNFQNIKRLLKTSGWSVASGFTLLEMVISMGIFSVLVIAATGIMIQVSNARIKVSNTQATQDNIRFSLELITKEMRTGSSYTLTTHGNACGGAASGSNPTEISFTTAANETRVYYVHPATQTIMRITGSTNCTNAVPFTSEDVFVDRFNFILRGTNAGPSDGQPMVTITLRVRSRSPKLHLESTMDLQTTITQRFRDI